mmetsp:Transcript_18990/g.45819  ORF Transcript_18990/g.45819 Transcript_18990/m.45819 type:complete len:221 (+) Transcript_18990:250-912(+)
MRVILLWYSRSTSTLHSSNAPTRSCISAVSRCAANIRWRIASISSLAASSCSFTARMWFSCSSCARSSNATLFWATASRSCSTASRRSFWCTCSLRRSLVVVRSAQRASLSASRASASASLLPCLASVSERSATSSCRDCTCRSSCCALGPLSVSASSTSRRRCWRRALSVSRDSTCFSKLERSLSFSSRTSWRSVSMRSTAFFIRTTFCCSFTSISAMS